MADAMDLAQQREQEDRERISTPHAAASLRPLVSSAKNATHQSRKLAVLRYRACSAASLAKKFQSLKVNTITEVLYEHYQYDN